MSNHTSQAPVTLFRVIGIGVLFLSTSIACLEIPGIVNQVESPDNKISVFSLLVVPLLIIVGGVIVAALFEALARVITALATNGRHHSEDGPSQVLQQLLQAVTELQTTLPGSIAQIMQQPVEETEESAGMPTLDVLPGSNVELHLERMVKLLEEMKEVSMLDETQRQARRQTSMVRRKSARLEEVARLINRQDWPQADALLHLLESLHAGDPDVLAVRNQLDDARIATQADEWERVVRQVEDFLALSKYSQAISVLMQFLERYPTHTDGQHLALRVKHEQQIYTENHSLRLYDEIKSAVENRQWRTALLGIQTFLDRFPEHPRANKIRQQVRVIQKNAEIEERHEQEDRIRDLINTGRFSEAADLAEDLLARFPDSPQAAYLTETTAEAAGAGRCVNRGRGFAVNAPEK